MKRRYHSFSLKESSVVMFKLATLLIFQVYRSVETYGFSTSSVKVPNLSVCLATVTIQRVAENPRGRCSGEIVIRILSSHDKFSFYYSQFPASQDESSHDTRQ